MCRHGGVVECLSAEYSTLREKSVPVYFTTGCGKLIRCWDNSHTANGNEAQSITTRNELVHGFRFENCLRPSL